MADQLVVIEGRVARTVALAPRNADGAQNAAVRQNHLAELGVVGNLSPDQAAAVEDSYFTWVNAGTRNTGVTLTVATGVTYAATQALCVVANNNPAGGPDVILRSLRIKIDAVITAGTFWYLYHAMDSGNRYSSGGTLMTGYNAAGGQPSGILAYTGVVTAAVATGSVRDIGENLILNGVGVAFAEIVIMFGGAERGLSGVFTTPTTAVAQSMVYAPPVVVHPGQSYVMNEFQTARTAAGSGEFFLEGIVR